MPVRIEERKDLTPPRLYNHFEVVDQQGRQVILTAEDIEHSINKTVDEYLAKSPYLVVAFVHENVNLLSASKIVMKRDVIQRLVNHPNLLGLAVINAEHSYFKVLIEIAKGIWPTLKISIFKSPEELDAYIRSYPHEFFKAAAG